MRTVLTCACAVALVATAGGAVGGYLDEIDAARPAAAALLEQTAMEWRAAPVIVKDAVGFRLFQIEFPNKRAMSQDDMIACMNRESAEASVSTAVVTLFKSCAGLR